MIDNQAKLTGLRPKSELTGLKVNTSVSTTSNTNVTTTTTNTNVNQDVVNHQIDINNLPDGENTNKSSLQKNDALNKSTLISSGIAGGVAAFKTAQNVGAIGESMRIQTVQNAVNEIEMRTNASNSRGFFGGNNNNNYNSYDNNRYGYNSYDDYADYGGTEMMRRRSSPRLEYFEQQNRSYEMNLALKNIASGTLQGAKYGTIIGGAVSSVVNAYNVITGKASGKEAVGTVAADTVTAGISGASGALTGGFASLGLGMIGMGGIPGLIVASGVGLAGAVGAQFLLQKTGIYNSIKEKVMNMMGGNK